MENTLLPGYVLVIDYILGVVMWTLVARSVIDCFITTESTMVIARVFRQTTNPIISIFAPITPTFLIKKLVPIYVAWWFYMIRFYVIPFVFLGELAMLSFPLESEIGRLFDF